MPLLEVVTAVRNHVIRDENNEPTGFELQVKTSEIEVDSIGVESDWTPVVED
ncbi:MAG: hypothetical protein ACKO96_02110 [Flammeovirgaceae bacterium]